jgi:hypothetical protein
MPSVRIHKSEPKETDYLWPRYSIGPERHLHALGIISVNYNLFEFGLASLLEYYASSQVSDFFFDRLNNQERLDAIRHFATAQEREPAVLELVEHLISYFSTCNHNRNILMHSKYREGDHPDDVLPLEKKAADEPARLLYFRLLLPELRRVADQIMRGVTFLSDILEYLRARDDVTAASPSALPRRPRAPRILNPYAPAIPRDA